MYDRFNTNNEIFVFMALLAFKLFNRKFDLKAESTTETVKRQGTFEENTKFHGQITAKL